MRRLVLGLGLFLLAVAIACTGSDPDAPSSDPRGAENQACFENNTCRGTLTCVSGLCVAGSDGDGGSSGTGPTHDAATAGGEDAGPKSCDGVGFCESFEGDVGDWYQDDLEDGRTDLDKNKGYGGKGVALKSTLPMNASVPTSGRIKHEVATNGKASWSARVWHDPLPSGIDILVLLDLAFPGVYDGSDTESGFQLQLTPNGYKLVLKGAGDYGLDDTRGPATANTWIDVRFDFDFAESELVATIGAQKITATSILIGGNAAISNVTIAVGLKAKSTGAMNAHAWFDDVRFTPQ